MLVKEVNLFPTPVWVYRFTDFDKHKADMYRYFEQPEIWLENEKRNNLVATRANLHKEALLSPFISFVQKSLEDVMGRLGYQQSVGITSMWGTKHYKGGFHHFHTHRNSFLGAVFYMRDDSGKSFGTTFHNMNNAMYQIQPAFDSTKAQYFKSSETAPFDIGSLLVFPAWVPHSTHPCEGDERVVVAVNAMPIGMTNSDHYDRYNYSDPAIMDLKQYAPIV